jgi:hypothetical protein
VRATSQDASHSCNLRRRTLPTFYLSHGSRPWLWVLGRPAKDSQVRPASASKLAFELNLNYVNRGGAAQEELQRVLSGCEAVSESADTNAPAGLEALICRLKVA